MVAKLLVARLLVARLLAARLLAAGCKAAFVKVPFRAGSSQPIEKSCLMPKFEFINQGCWLHGCKAAGCKVVGCKVAGCIQGRPSEVAKKLNGVPFLGVCSGVAPWAVHIIDGPTTQACVN